MDRDGYQSFVKIGPNWIPLETYKNQKAQKSLELAVVMFCAAVGLFFLLAWRVL